MSRRVAEVAYYHVRPDATGEEPLALLCGGWELCRADYAVRRRFFRHHVIEFVAEGKGMLQLAGISHALVPGTAFSYGPGIAHSIVTDPAAVMTKYFVVFTGTEADTLLRGTGLNKGAVRVADPCRVRRLLDDLQQHATNPGPHAEAICLLLLRMLPLLVDTCAARPHDGPSRNALAYQRCRQIMEERCLSLHSLQDIAGACQLHPAALCRLFKQYGDLSPYRHLLYLKMRRAAQRIMNEGALVKQLYEEMGYSDPYHFSRAFKRVHGFPPQHLIDLAHDSE